MKLHDRIRVEPLDDERLANLERRIVARAGDAASAPAAGSWRALAFAGIATAIAASAAIGWKLHGDSPVLVAHDTTLAVTTGSEHSTVALDDATIDSAPNTQLSITRGDHRVVVEMTRGRVELAVAHREDHVVIVRAGDTEIEDVGTRFAVDYAGADAGGRVAVAVTEGEVAVTKAGKAVRVTAGATWSSGAELVAANVPAPADHVVDSEPVAIDGRHADTWHNAPEPTIALHDRHVEPPPSPTSSTSVTVHASTSAHPTSARARPPETHAPVVTDPYVDLKLAIKRQPLEFDPNIDGVGDAANEIGRLKKIAYSPTTLGADASQALYSIAVLLHKPLHQDGEALRTLDVYRRRFAGGSELHAAAWLRVRIRCEHTIDDECRKAAYAYQHEVPVGSAAEVAIRITNAQ